MGKYGLHLVREFRLFDIFVSPLIVPEKKYFGTSLKI